MDINHKRIHEIGEKRTISQKHYFGMDSKWAVNFPQQRVSAHTITSVDKNFEALWKLNEFTTPITHLSENDEHCEKFFMETTYRDPSGRFVVSTSFKDNHSPLGDSRTIA